MQRIKSIGVVSVGKQCAVVWAAVGLLLSPFTFSATRSDPKWGGVIAVTVDALIVGPIGFAFLGFVFSGFATMVYNWTAKWTGGIQIELTDAAPSSASARAGH